MLMAAILPAYGSIYCIQNRLNHVSQRRLMEQTAELDA